MVATLVKAISTIHHALLSLFFQINLKSKYDINHYDPEEFQQRLKQVSLRD